MRTRLKSVAVCFDLTVLLLLHRTFCACTEPNQEYNDIVVTESQTEFDLFYNVRIIISRLTTKMNM